MAAKDKHKKKMLEYWGDPENDFINRITMHTDVLKISGPCFYKHFTPSEVQDIEFEAFELRKKHSTKDRARIYKALLRDGLAGDVAASKEYLNRTEGKVVDKKEVKMDGMEIKPIINVTTTRN